MMLPTLRTKPSGCPELALNCSPPYLGICRRSEVNRTHSRRQGIDATDPQRTRGSQGVAERDLCNFVPLIGAFFYQPHKSGSINPLPSSSSSAVGFFQRHGG